MLPVLFFSNQLVREPNISHFSVDSGPTTRQDGAGHEAFPRRGQGRRRFCLVRRLSLSRSQGNPRPRQLAETGILNRPVTSIVDERTHDTCGTTGGFVLTRSLRGKGFVWGKSARRLRPAVFTYLSIFFVLIATRSRPRKNLIIVKTPSNIFQFKVAETHYYAGK